jgi:small multidrug resistance family-3 protein
MDAARVLVIFALSAAGEIGGTYAIWRWRRDGSSGWLVLVGAVLLTGYALVQTYQPDGDYGRIYAAYGGFFLFSAMMWGWLGDGVVPDRFDVIGVAVALTGAAIILWGRRLFG